MNGLRIASILVLLVIGLSAWAGAGEIHEAVKECDLQKVHALLEKNHALLNHKNEAGMTPLNIAARAGDAEIVTALLALGADIEIGDCEGSKPIHNAAVSGVEDVVELLLAKGADVSDQDANGLTPLHFATDHKRISMAEYLLENGADVNAKTAQGWGPLLYATIGGNKYLVTFLIEKGADVNARNSEGVAPLHSAASYGKKKIARLLIENGADVNIQNERGDTPLGWALNPFSLSVAQLLIEAGADVNHSSKGGRTALHGVAHRGSLLLAELLIEQGADVNAVDDNGWTPLTNGAFSGAAMVKFLLAKGAKVKPSMKKAGKADGPSMTPLHAAARHGDEDSVGLLIDAGADINAKNAEGITPMHLAIAAGRTGMVKRFLSKGAEPNIEDCTYGRTPLHGAAIRGYGDIVKLLIKSGSECDLKDLAGKTPLDYANYHGFKKVAGLLSKEGMGQGAGAMAHEKLLNAPLKLKEAVIWYLRHSGWVIKTKNHFLIFDYFEFPDRIKPAEASLASGYVDPEKIKDQNVCVFVSHGHGDHYYEGIYGWKEKIPGIDFVLGFKPPSAKGKYRYIGPRLEETLDGIKISTIKSTDEGVAFLVEVDGLTIYHSGDHANGHAECSKQYKKEIDYLAQRGLAMDLAFFPITGCGLGDPDSVREGILYAVEKFKPRILFPMHAGDRTFKYKEFADKASGKVGDTVIVCPVNEGDRYIFRNAEMLANM